MPEARKLGTGWTPAQIALARLPRQPDLMVIPKAADPQHVRENRGALEVAPAGEDLKELDRAFPPPTRKWPQAPVTK